MACVLAIVSSSSSCPFGPHMEMENPYCCWSSTSRLTRMSSSGSRGGERRVQRNQPCLSSLSTSGLSSSTTARAKSKSRHSGVVLVISRPFTRGAPVCHWVWSPSRLSVFHTIPLSHYPPTHLATFLMDPPEVTDPQQVQVGVRVPP